METTPEITLFIHECTSYRSLWGYVIIIMVIGVAGVEPIPYVVSNKERRTATNGKSIQLIIIRPFAYRGLEALSSSHELRRFCCFIISLFITKLRLNNHLKSSWKSMERQFTLRLAMTTQVYDFNGLPKKQPLPSLISRGPTNEHPCSGILSQCGL